MLGCKCGIPFVVACQTWSIFHVLFSWSGVILFRAHNLVCFFSPFAWTCSINMPCLIRCLKVHQGFHSNLISILDVIEYSLRKWKMKDNVNWSCLLDTFTHRMDQNIIFFSFNLRKWRCNGIVKTTDSLHQTNFKIRYVVACSPKYSEECPIRNLRLEKRVQNIWGKCQCFQKTSWRTATLCFPCWSSFSLTANF